VLRSHLLFFFCDRKDMKTKPNKHWIQISICSPVYIYIYTYIDICTYVLRILTQHTYILALQYIWIPAGFLGVPFRHLSSNREPNMQFACECVHTRTRIEPHIFFPAQTNPSRWEQAPFVEQLKTQRLHSQLSSKYTHCRVIYIFFKIA